MTRFIKAKLKKCDTLNKYRVAAKKNVITDQNFDFSCQAEKDNTLHGLFRDALFNFHSNSHNYTKPFKVRFERFRKVFLFCP